MTHDQVGLILGMCGRTEGDCADKPDDAKVHVTVAHLRAVEAMVRSVQDRGMDPFYVEPPVLRLVGPGERE